MSTWAGRYLVMLLLPAALSHLPLVASAPQDRATHPSEFTFQIVHAYPHDTGAFTQGLAYSDGYLYESTGLNGRSSLRKVRLETGEVVQRIDLSLEFFGEGIAILNGRVIQLTWLSHLGFVYDASNFKLLRQFSYPGEGWGLATDGREMFMSDGTSAIRVLDPDTLQEKRRLQVHDGNVPIDRLNELEFIDGEIFANVWQTDKIARISPQSGRVVGWIFLNGLLSPIYRAGPDAVLNGIAYDSTHKRLFVTGKLWPRVFEIRLVQRPRLPSASHRQE